MPSIPPKRRRRGSEPEATLGSPDTRARAVKEARARSETAWLNALERAFDDAVAGHDPEDALKWGRVRVKALQDLGDMAEPSLLASAHAPMWRLHAEAGSASRAVEAAKAWLQAETRVGAHGRVRDALLAVAEASRLAALQRPSGDAMAAWVRAVRSLRLACESAVAGATDADPFEHARLADALKRTAEIATLRGEWSEAVEAEEQWLSLARRIGDGPLQADATRALTASLARGGDWERCVATARDFDRDALEPWVLARLAWIDGDASAAIRAADRALENPETGDAPSTLSVAAMAMHTLVPVRAGAVRERLLRTSMSRARTWSESRSAAASARASALAWLSLAEWDDDSVVLAQSHADAAITALRRDEAPPDTSALLVSYVHETVSRGRVRRSTRAEPVLAPVGRALAALDANDDARAARHLLAIDLDGVHSADALAHVLAAATRILAALAPDDPALADGRSAWQDLGAFALIPSARPGLTSSDLASEPEIAG